MPINAAGVAGFAAEWVTIILVALVNMGVLFLILLLLREVVTWYFKINVMVKQQEETNRLLKQLVDQASCAPQAQPFHAVSPTPTNDPERPASA